MDEIDNLSDISGLSEISDDSNLSDIDVEDNLDKNIINEEKRVRNLNFLSKRGSYLDSLFDNTEISRDKEELVDEEDLNKDEDSIEQEDENEENLISELSKMQELDEINISNIRNFVKENLVDYIFIEQDDILIFQELKKGTNLIIICIKEGIYQRVKFISYDEEHRSILVRSNRLNCNIGLDEDYVYCYKNDKIGQREAMEVLLKALESGEIIINKREGTNNVESSSTNNIKRDRNIDKKLERILKNIEDKSVKIEMDKEIETRKVYIEYASNIGEKELLLEIDQ